MQKLKYSLLTLIVILIGISCNDEPLPFDTFDEFEKDNYPRITNINDNYFFLTNPEISVFNFDVEYYTEEEDVEIVAHEWFVSHSRDTISTPVSFISLSSEDFGTNSSSGLPAASFEFSMEDAMAKLGLTIDDIRGNDDFIFDGFITLNDGKVLGPDDIEESVLEDDGFEGIFRIVKPVKCLTELDGIYDAKTTLTNQMADISWDECKDSVWVGQIKIESICNDELIFSSITEVKLEDIDSTVVVELFDMSMGSYNACYGTASQGTTPNGAAAATEPTLKFKFLDGKLSYEGKSQWDYIYSLEKVEVNDLDLTLEWVNNYGEGAKTVITRTEEDGDWPPISK